MRSITDVIRQFKLNWTEQLDAQAIAAACQHAQMSWLESTLNPIVTDLCHPEVRHSALGIRSGLVCPEGAGLVDVI